MHTNYFGNNTMPTVIYISSAERKRNYTWFEDGNTLHDENIAFCTLDDLRFTTIDYPANLKDQWFGRKKLTIRRQEPRY